MCTGRERKIDVTEAILHGLAYTLLSHALWAICQLPGSLIPTPDIVGLSFCAMAIGAGLSVAINRRLAFSSLRWLGLTRQPEFPSVWETVFQVSERDLGEYVVVELDDDRRMLGAILGVSPSQQNGHMCLQHCQWLPTQLHETSVQIDGWFLVPATRIKSVHFLPRINADEQRSSEVTAPVASIPTTPGTGETQ